MAHSRFAVVLGATSIVGPHLCARLAEAGFSGECISRQARPDDAAAPKSFDWRRFDLSEPGGWAAPPGAVVFSLAPLWLLPEWLSRLEAARQIVAVGTTSLFSKASSADPREVALAERVGAAERRIRERLGGTACGWTILRPTLIYDPGRDGNVSEIARFIERFGVFPIVRPASGLRQPIHADDVAAAALAAVDNPAARDQAFNLTGGETLPYREMVRRVFVALDRRPTILPLPAGLLRAAFGAARPFWGTRYSVALLERMNQDLAFDGAPARQVLGVTPRAFHPVFPKRRR